MDGSVEAKGSVAFLSLISQIRRQTQNSGLFLGVNADSALSHRLKKPNISQCEQGFGLGGGGLFKERGKELTS